MEQKCKSGAPVRKSCFHIKYKGWKKKKKGKLGFPPNGWSGLESLLNISRKEGRGEEKPEGEEERTEGGREVGFPLPGFHLNALGSCKINPDAPVSAAASLPVLVDCLSWHIGLFFLPFFLNKRIKLIDKLCGHWEDWYAIGKSFLNRVKVLKVNPSRICGAPITIVKVAPKLSSNEMHILTQKSL